MKKLLLLTTLFLALACSKDDEGENNEENQTFLQKYDGFGYTDGEEYWFFYDNNIFLRYVDTEDEPIWCQEMREGVNTVDGTSWTVKIVTNNSESLLFEATVPGENDSEVYEFTVDITGNNLTLDLNDDSEEPITTYRKTATTYSSLCN